ncbi:MAG: molybdopterin oxidoreductase family protein [Moraxellaceae bacterium]
MDASLHYRTCHLCEAMCGIEIQHHEGEIRAIRGDKADPFSGGHVCPKAVALKDLQEDPDRLRRPVKRVGDDWVEISWDEAFALVETNLRRVQRDHGRDAVALYVGNPTAHNTGALLMLPALVGSLRTKNRYSATSVDQLPVMLASLQMFGHQALLPVPDLDRTDFLLMLGANPAASNGSIMTAGNVMGRIKAIRARGGRVTLLDPRRTETADSVDEHFFIRPGSDAFFLAAMLNVIFSEGLARMACLGVRTSGADRLEALVRPFTPEAVAAHTGLAASRTRQLARDFAAAERAVCYGRIGTSVQEHGGLCMWLIYALNVVTGNLDREGGAMFPLAAIDLAGLSSVSALLRGSFDSYRSRVRNLPEFGGEYPVATLADEMLTPGAGQVRALVSHAGNPVLSTPNGRKLDEALAGLDFYCAIDIYINETTRHAHVILPPTGPLEHGHYDIVFNAVAVRNVAKWSPPLLNPPAGALHDWQIILELVVRLNARTPFERTLWRGLQAYLERLGLEGMLDWALRTGPYGGTPLISRADHLLSEFLFAGKLYQGAKRLLDGMMGRWPGARALLRSTALFSGEAQGLTLDVLRRHPHGVDLGALKPLLAERIATADGAVALAPALYVEGMQRLLEQLSHVPADNAFRLIGRRHMRSNNSWLHNSHRLIKGPNRCTLLMHPADAARLGIADGMVVSVRSRVGEIRLPAELSDNLMPGVVSVPHGFGHDRAGVRLGTAQKAPGVSLNDITDETLVDALAGTAILNGIPVTVMPAASMASTAEAPTAAMSE